MDVERARLIFCTVYQNINKVPNLSVLLKHTRFYSNELIDTLDPLKKGINSLISSGYFDEKFFQFLNLKVKLYFQMDLKDFNLIMCQKI